ncbi:serine hydrolase domain-containing protein [Microbacterium sp. NPDC089696]|uniref:serine hydrolase domain-containing protein n=1 Tax=Microbacterium sp. NPDC089696 TaxID=3364199 RepID=UPI003804222B
MLSRIRSPRSILSLVGGIAVAGVVLAGCSAPPSSSESSSASPSAQSESTPFDPETVKALDGILDAAVTEHGMPGVTLAVWSPDGDYVSSAGHADVDAKTAMTPELHHRIGSVTKTFVITALLRLVDQGKASLDDPISEYVDGVTRGDEITLRQLAAMTAGVPDYTEDPEFVGMYLPDPQVALTPRDLVDEVSGMPLTDEPGAEMSYSNTNTVLVGMAIEKITGEPLAEVLQEEVAEPLGLENTFLPTATEFPEPHAQGYTAQQSDDGSVTAATDWNPSWAWASGGMISTLDDLRIWVPALATGELLSPEMQKERLTVTPVNPEQPDWGYGLGIFNLGGWIGHNGSLPGYKTVTIYLPEKEMTIVAFVNSDAPGSSDLGSGLVTPVTELLTPEAPYVLD